MATTQKNDTIIPSEAIQKMFEVGAHFAFTRSRRHPTVAPFIFGVKNRVEIFDLEKTHPLLEKAEAFVKKLGLEGKQLLFVGGKSEARDAIRQGAQSIDMPYVSGRWIGGTISNFKGIRSRADRFLDLTAKRESGELAKYTKKERLLIDREIEKLDRFFSGIISMKSIPDALFIVDPKHEHIAMTEALKAGIPVIALAGSDCNLKHVTCPVPGNDSSVGSVTFFVDRMVWAYKEGKNERLKAQATK
ncbi:MAG: 30S ribosomal protein S2 [Candidatus Taylorbacteria bacterium]|nr:30S ribosomal protein S2 [Candidatus Taylorbacteria bacterium]